jgi:hypothetical protein
MLPKVRPPLEISLELADGTTGPLGLAGFASTIASVAYRVRFSDLASAYVITPSVSADQQEFFHYPNYTQAALTLFTTAKSEYSLGQLSACLTFPRLGHIADWFG